MTEATNAEADLERTLESLRHWLDVRRNGTWTSRANILYLVRMVRLLRTERMRLAKPDKHPPPGIRIPR